MAAVPATTGEPSEFNIRVVCRFRPLNESENKASSSSVVKFPHGRDDTVFVSGKVYVFDKVFGPYADQEKVYDEAAREIVSDILNGYNGTIFAYGQTSSGKTHTMEGSLEGESHQGIIPRIVSDIFDHIYSMDTNLQFQIKISYFEIYMDKIRDLLDPNKVNLAVHEDKNRVPYVKGCTERFVASPEEVLCAIEEGKANRHIAVTNMNEHSSRSHSVFLIDVKQENLETDKKLTGKLYLVDLAGSEKVSKTGAEGSVLDEAKNINKSLSALGNVIAALADGTKSHVPYRDSKLTRILQESLGGNARTTVIICCSPASFNECETKSTLYFGQRAKMIKNTVIVNEELTAEEWKRRYDREHERVVKLRGQLAAAERELLRWRSGQKVDQGEMVVLRYADRSNSVEGDDNDGSFDENMVDQFMIGENNLNRRLSNLSDPVDHKRHCGNRLRSDFPFGNSNHEDSLVGTSITDDERVLIVEKQCNALYRQLDEKDEEITQLEQRMNVFREQQVEQDDLISQLRQVNECIQADQSSIHLENEKSKEEVKELLSALEELAISYEQKTGELRAKIDADTDLIQNHEQNIQQLELVRNEFDNYKQCTSYQQRYISTSFSEIVNDLKILAEVIFEDNGDICGVELSNISTSKDTNSDVDYFATNSLSADQLSTEISFDREISSCKIIIARLNVEGKLLRQHTDQIKEHFNNATSTLDTQKIRIDEYTHTIRELNARLSSLKEAKEEVDNNLKVLQHSVGNRDSCTDNEVAEKELEEKRKMIDDLRERLSVVLATKDSLSEEFYNLRTLYTQKCEEMEKYIREKQCNETARQELALLEQTVAKELQNLFKIRKLFVTDLNQRIHGNHIICDNSLPFCEKNGPKSSNLEVIDYLPSKSDNTASFDENTNVIFNHECGSLAQKNKVEFLEENLKNLTVVYKELVRENADLLCEIPKLEKRLKATYDRLRSLENALKEAKDSATKDRKKYMTELNRIREVVKSRNVTRRGNAPQIVKPIKAGQNPCIYMSQGNMIGTSRYQQG